MEDEKKTDRPLPAGWGWRAPTSYAHAWLGHADDKPDGASAVARSFGHWTVFRDRSTRILAEGRAKPRTNESLLAAAQREAEAALWARDGFGVGRVYGLALGDEWAERVGDALNATGATLFALPGLPGLWRVTLVSSARPLTIDAVRAPDTQAEADAPPLTHALDAEGNALCPYDPERLAYVSQRPERVTCPRCREAMAEPAPREPSAPDELARLLPGLAHDLDMVTDLRFESQRSTPIQRVARACELLLDERERMARAVGISDAMVSRATRDLATASARVAELEAAPAGHRVAALLRAMDDAAKDAVEETDDRPDHVRTGRPFAYVEGLREAARLVREHLGAPSPEDFVKLPRLSDAEIQAALDKGRAEAFPAHHPFAAHLTAPSPLDLAVAEVCAVDAAEVADTFDAWAALGDICRAEADGLAEERAQFAKAGRVALAGMLACDAKGGPK